jgi:hypothetical protein
MASAGGQSSRWEVTVVSGDEVLDVREAASLLGVDEGSPGRRAPVRPEDLDRLLAEAPDEPPTPAEQAARDDNDALGDR